MVSQPSQAVGFQNNTVIMSPLTRPLTTHTRNPAIEWQEDSIYYRDDSKAKPATLKDGMNMASSYSSIFNLYIIATGSYCYIIALKCHQINVLMSNFQNFPGGMSPDPPSFGMLCMLMLYIPRSFPINIITSLMVCPTNALELATPLPKVFWLYV